MNRIKINVLVSVFVLIAFLSCVGVSFSATKTYMENQFSLSTEEFERLMHNLVFNYDTDDNNESIEGFMFLAARESYPNVVGVYNDKAELVASSGSRIVIYGSDNKPNKYINIEPYLTDKLKSQIREYAGNSSSNVEPIKIDYAVVDNELVPVNLYLLKFTFLEYKCFKLSDYDIDGSYINDCRSVLGKEDSRGEEAMLEVSFYNIFENKGNEKIYNTLNDSLSSEEVLDLVSRSIDENTSYGVGSVEGLYIADGRMYYQGEQYAVYYQMTHNICNDIIHSYIFTDLFKVEVAIFAVMLAVLIIICNLLYSKSKRLSNSRNAFISAAAHELKTPLAAIENNSECLIEGIAPEKNEKYIRTIHNEGLRMNELVASLLQYNRLTTVSQIKKSTCSLSDIVNKELEQYEVLIDGKGVLLETDIIPSAQIKASEELIALVVDNFLSNAVKHTDKGKKIIVKLEALKKSKYRLSVFNEGEKIDKKYSKNLWDAFYRADKVRNSNDKSTGMGLAICKQILDHHNAKYGFANKQNGVEFYFVI